MFPVDMNGAGEGELEFCVTGPLGTLLPNQVRTIGNDSYSVVFVPVQCGQHQITATFNGLPISGVAFVIVAFAALLGLI